MQRLLVLVLFCAGCALPRDPCHTLERVQGGTMRVGVIHSPPWVCVDGESFRGVEVELVRLLAEELDAEVRWVPGGESQLLEALEKFELDLVIGGMTRDSPWEKRIGLTSPYCETHWRIGVPEGQSADLDLDEVTVAVRPDDFLAAALVREEGGIPKEVEDPAQSGLPAVAEDWQLDAWGLAGRGSSLLSHEQVFALPPGENRWLLYLDQFLHRSHTRVPALLRQEARR